MSRIEYGDKKVSIIVPVYNAEDYLKQCLSSIVNQTYSNIEIIVIDDGSTDESGNICDQYAKKDDRIRVFHTENCGISKARNFGLDQANGCFIGFVDSDDWIETNMIEHMMCNVNNEGIDVIECSYYVEKTHHSHKTLSGVGLFNKEEVQKELIRGTQSSFVVWNKLYRADLFGYIKFPDGHVYEDVLVTSAIADIITAWKKIDDSLYHYRDTPKSLSKQKSLDKLCDHWLAVKFLYESYYDRVGQAERRILLQRCANTIIQTWRYYFSNTKIERARFDISRELQEMSQFARENFTHSRTKGYPVSWRIGLLLARYNKSWSFALSCFMQFLSEAKRRNKELTTKQNQ